jgi:alkylation response protein AidB-like acyl-CoA dehydrogenase
VSADSDGALLEELNAFIVRELPAHQLEWGNSSSFDARVAWQRRLASGRFLPLSWPVEHGGRALPIQDRLRCEQALALAGAPVPAGTLGLNNVGPTLIAFGTPEQQTHLPRIVDASEIWCQGFSEPDAGSDLASLRTAAHLVDDVFEITGHKVWTTNGLQATHCLLLARTDAALPKHHGISVLLVTLDSPGIERRSIRQMDGGEEFAEVFFDKVRVPRDSLLGPLHDGWRVVLTTLSYERAGVISEAPLLEREVNKDLARLNGHSSPLQVDELMSLYIESRVLTFLGARALATLSNGRPPGPEHALIRLAQSSLRQRLAEARFRSGGLAVTGGQGLEVERALLTARSVSIAAGTREVLKNVVAERVLGLPR